MLHLEPTLHLIILLAEIYFLASSSSSLRFLIALEKFKKGLVLSVEPLLVFFCFIVALFLSCFVIDIHIDLIRCILFNLVLVRMLTSAIFARMGRFLSITDTTLRRSQLYLDWIKNALTMFANSLTKRELTWLLRLVVLFLFVDYLLITIVFV